MLPEPPISKEDLQELQEFTYRSSEVAGVQELQNGASDFWSMESQLALDSEPAIVSCKSCNS
jgi:hypothetical protein